MGEIAGYGNDRPRSPPAWPRILACRAGTDGLESGAMFLPVVHPAQPRNAGFDTGPRSIGAVRVLRISITDRCNYRCLYCMPEAGVKWLAGADILGTDEIVAVVKAAVEVYGISRFKLTGGEPTVRAGLVELVARLAAIPGVEDLSMTTN